DKRRRTNDERRMARFFRPSSFVLRQAPLSLLCVALLLAVCLGACAPAAVSPVPATASPGSAQAYLARGDQYAEARDFGNAIASYSQAIQLQPDYAEAYNNRGLAYALESKGNMAQAIADYTQAIAFRPGYAVAYNNRGVAYMASGHPEQAISDFNSAVALKP